MVARLSLAVLSIAALAASSPATAEPTQPGVAAQPAQATQFASAAELAPAAQTGQLPRPEQPTRYSEDAATVPGTEGVDTPQNLHSLALAEAAASTPEPVDSLPVLPEAVTAGASGAAALLREPLDAGEFGAAYELSARDADSFLNRLTTRIKQLVAQAMTYLGTPYRRGGSSRQGLDCSGLVGAVYGQQGLEMPRTAAEQFGEGVPVAFADLRPGDLVFFRDTYKHGISHVGIYLGESRFIHAAGRRQGVIVSDLGRPYYQSRFAGARRLATQTADARLDVRRAGENGESQSKIEGSRATSTPSVALRNR